MFILLLSIKHKFKKHNKLEVCVCVCARVYTHRKKLLPYVIPIYMRWLVY